MGKTSPKSKLTSFLLLAFHCHVLRRYYYIKIKSRNKFIIIEQRSYDTEIKLIKRRLFEIKERK